MDSYLRQTVNALKILKEIRVVASPSAGLPSYVSELVGAQSTIQFTGLNGASELEYRVMGRILNTATNDTQIMRFNGVSSNVYDYNYSQLGSTGGNRTGSTTSYIEINISTGSSSIELWDLRVMANTGVNRGVLIQTTRGGASQNGFSATYAGAGNWRNSVDAITSITFGYGSISNGYGIGTIIRLYAI